MKYAIPRYYVNPEKLIWLSYEVESGIYLALWLDVLGVI